MAKAAAKAAVTPIEPIFNNFILALDLPKAPDTFFCASNVPSADFNIDFFASPSTSIALILSFISSFSVIAPSVISFVKSCNSTL